MLMNILMFIQLYQINKEHICLESEYKKAVSSIIMIIRYRKMDLPYPTIKNGSFNNQFNQLDKLARSILLSTHEIPLQNCINKNIKQKICRAISTDNAKKLHRIIEKEVVPYGVQIGTRGSRWNILHFCAKNNAHLCLQYILKTQYQVYPEEYKALVNQKTVEGYTVLIISIINRSHKVLEKILQFGGVDIHVIDQHKMSAYQIALNYRNDKAIRLLMNYESKTKKKQYINHELLSQAVNFPPATCCQSLMSCLLSCITFGLCEYEQNEGFQFNEDNRIKVTDFIIEQDFIDYVPINSKKQLKGYDIQWKKASQLMDGKLTIFDSYNPFEIIEPNFTINNNLIIFQCLSQQPWLIRRSVKADRCRTNYYNVFLYPRKMIEKQTIDDYIPFIKDRNEAMFLSCQQQMWPMLLQKALAKLHNSYFALTDVEPRLLLEELTGFPTVQIKLSKFPVNQVIQIFQQISARNYLLLLKGKLNSQLCQSSQKIECFTVLNFYQKSSEQKILINCPFVSEKWKEKEKNQSLALKLIKGHYNTHRQMCVWIQAKKINQYFDSVILSLSFLNYERTQLRLKTKQFMFFKFRVENRKDENIYFQLNSQKSSSVYSLNSLQVLKNEGKEIIQLQDGYNKTVAPHLAQLLCKPGQYMCCYHLQETQQVLPLFLLCWSPQPIQPEFVEPELGILEWLGFLKNHFHNVGQQCVLQVLGQFSLVLFRQKTKNIVLLRININSDLIIEGRKDDETGYIEMENQQNIHYCVIKKIIKAEDIIFDQKKPKK